MTTIDQRILVPASQSVVWSYLSDLSRNPDWQQNCRAVSFLSSKRTGVGTRWRVTHADGHDGILEVISWYNGLGYEYGYVDGSPFKSANGRIRLQEIAEGTIVQWTFTFEVKGVLSGIRGAARQVENEMAASLKALYRQIKALPKGQAAPSLTLMQDAPDASGRSSYQPRHASAYGEKRAYTPTQPFPAVSEPLLTLEPAPAVEDSPYAPVSDFAFDDEPPIEQFDTRPRPAIMDELATPTEADVMPSEQDFLGDASLQEAPTPAVHEASDLEFDFDIEAASHDSEVPVEELDRSAGTDEAVFDRFATHELAQIEEEAPSAEPEASDLPDEPVMAAESAPEPLPEAERVETAPTEVIPLAVDDSASSQRTIWEIFGVARPGTPDTPATEAEPPRAADPVTSSAGFVLRGKRAAERRNSVRVRFPK